MSLFRNSKGASMKYGSTKCLNTLKSYLRFENEINHSRGVRCTNNIINEHPKTSVFLFAFKLLLCEADPLSLSLDPCPKGFTYVSSDYRCYYYDYRHQLSWLEAVEFCKWKDGFLLALETAGKFDRFMAWYHTSECSLSLLNQCHL